MTLLITSFHNAREPLYDKGCLYYASLTRLC